VRRLVGVFAFAVWDERTGALFAARSPISAPMLMYAVRSSTLAFATSPGGLHSLPFVPRALDEEGLLDVLAPVGDGPPEATLYRHVSRLLTGHRLIADRHGVRTQRYWRPDPRREIRYARDEDYVLAFNELLDEVVADQLRSTTPVSVMMSGGLDSSSVAAVAARLLAAKGERLTAFTEVPPPGTSGPLLPGRYADETPYVEAVAALHDNLDLHLVRTDGEVFWRHLDPLFRHLQMPFGNTPNRVWMEAIERRSAEAGMRVVLDGAQGNLTMSWNGAGLLPGLLRSGHWLEARRQARSLARSGASRAAWRALAGQGVLPLLPDALWLTVDRLRSPSRSPIPAWAEYSPVSPAFAAARRLPERTRSLRYAARFRPRADSREVRFELLASQDIGAYTSAVRSQYGVDLRTPPADVRLAEFCLALPEDQFQRDGVSRRLVRRAMAAQLPAEVVDNSLRGQQASDWYARLYGARDELAAELTRLERSDLAREYLDLSRMRRLYEQMPAAPADWGTIMRDYYRVLQHGVMVGRFLCWFEAGG
jgi:asparagine synthase (glutamine-hydrolysing)